MSLARLQESVLHAAPDLGPHPWRDELSAIGLWHWISNPRDPSARPVRNGAELPARTMCRECHDRCLWLFDHARVEDPFPINGADAECDAGCSLNQLLMDCLAMENEHPADDKPQRLGMWDVSLGVVKWTPSEHNHLGPACQALDILDLKARGWRFINGSYQRRALYYNIWGSSKKYMCSLLLEYNRGTSARNNAMTARPIPQLIELDLALSWMRACELLHGPPCSPPAWVGMGDAGLRMIDVHNRCLVDVKHQVDYLALSYCWGQGRDECPLRLSEHTVEDLYRKNTLADDRADLPQTIRDAILLTQRLGESLLWIDALCIFQDSRTDMNNQIQHMDKIYRHAKLTIVAAAGEDAHMGLPGLREGTRIVRQLRRRIGKMHFQSDYGKFFANALGLSTWNNRAWTLQEQILSPRLLSFTESAMSWNCNCAVWTEGLVLECFAKDTVIELDSQFKRGLKPQQHLTSLQKFNYYVGKASGRKLTFEGDRLKSIQGLLNSLSADFPGGFIWGMPVDIFDAAMLFHGVLWQEAPWEPRSGFPSWSWAGWMEDVATTVTSPYEIDCDEWWADVYESPDISPKSAEWARKEVAWHVLDDNGTEWRNIASESISSNGSLYYDASCKLWALTHEMLLREAKARVDQSGQPLSHVLGFWTQTIDLRVARHDDPPFTEEHSLAGGRVNASSCGVMDREGKFIARILLTENYRENQPDELRFMLVGSHRRWESTHGPIMDILHIETKDGITKRVQGVRECSLTLERWADLGANWEFILMV